MRERASCRGGTLKYGFSLVSLVQPARLEFPLLDPQSRRHLGLVTPHLFDEALGVLAAEKHLKRVAQREVGRECVVNDDVLARLGLFGRRGGRRGRSRRQREVRTGFAQDCERLLGEVDAHGIPRLVDLDHAAVDENAEPPKDAARMRKPPELAHADEWNPGAHGDSVGTSTALN